MRVRGMVENSLLLNLHQCLAGLPASRPRPANGSRIRRPVAAAAILHCAILPSHACHQLVPKWHQRGQQSVPQFWDCRACLPVSAWRSRPHLHDVQAPVLVVLVVLLGVGLRLWLVCHERVNARNFDGACPLAETEKSSRRRSLRLSR